MLSLLVLPLFIPVLIFGVAAVDAAAFGYPVRPHLLMLGGLLLASAGSDAVGGRGGAQTSD